MFTRLHFSYWKLFTFVLILSLWSPSIAVFAQSGDLQLDVKSAILIEASTGQILYQINADQAFPPASMSKMMTEYLVMEAVTSKKIKWEDIVTASKYASEVIGSGQLIAEGEQLAVRDMVTAMAVYSSNDASVALAEFVAGSEPSFSKLMNETAKKMGMTNSRFINSTGLSREDIGVYAPQDIEGESLMSARDVSTLARNLVTKHPEILDFSKITNKKLRASDESPMVNWNWMLEGNSGNVNFLRYSYPGLDGLKTGHTSEAGYCFTGTAVRNGMRLISVVMGASSEANRFLETRKLLDYGFNQFEMKSLVAANGSFVELRKVPIIKGVELEQSVVTAKELNVLVKKGRNLANVKPTFMLLDEGARTAPIKKGAVMAKATFVIDAAKYEVDLVATEDAEKGSWLRLMFRAIKDFFVGLFS
jgi:D-alanyl-D-alanine carboxypeptidase (penicillin-binding protein 5/6)